MGTRSKDLRMFKQLQTRVLWVATRRIKVQPASKSERFQKSTRKKNWLPCKWEKASRRLIWSQTRSSTSQFQGKPSLQWTALRSTLACTNWLKFKNMKTYTTSRRLVRSISPRRRKDWSITALTMLKATTESCLEIKSATASKWVSSLAKELSARSSNAETIS